MGEVHPLPMFLLQIIFGGQLEGQPELSVVIPLRSEPSHCDQLAPKAIPDMFMQANTDMMKVNIIFLMYVHLKFPD
jgi:hypothetical protein